MPPVSKKHDLTIISYHGREQSHLMVLDRVGQTNLRHFTGEYDLFGQPAYARGDVLLESVYRFKGQAAPTIILTEIDFEVLDDKAIRKMVVGATRSSMKLILVIHDRPPHNSWQNCDRSTLIVARTMSHTARKLPPSSAHNNSHSTFRRKSRCWRTGNMRHNFVGLKDERHREFHTCGRFVFLDRHCLIGGENERVELDVMGAFRMERCPDQSYLP